jgi:hypothetical protein
MGLVNRHMPNDFLLPRARACREARGSERLGFKGWIGSKFAKNVHDQSLTKKPAACFLVQVLVKPRTAVQCNGPQPS